MEEFKTERFIHETSQKRCLTRKRKALQGKWKNLKDAYRKHWKLQKSNKSGQARKQVKSYFYAAQLSFMKDVVELGATEASPNIPALERVEYSQRVEQERIPTLTSLCNLSLCHHVVTLLTELGKVTSFVWVPGSQPYYALPWHRRDSHGQDGPRALGVGIDGRGDRARDRHICAQHGVQHSTVLSGSHTNSLISIFHPPGRSIGHSSRSSTGCKLYELFAILNRMVPKGPVHVSSSVNRMHIPSRLLLPPPLLRRSMSSTPVPVPGSNRHLIEETLSHSQPSEGSPSRPISSSGRPLGEYGRHLVNSHVVGTVAESTKRTSWVSEEKKPRRTSLQVQLTKQPSSESLNFSPTSPGESLWD
uniref:Uncharacterized protein n=1 Tax=Timema tahoe TaxID=61484 RepID=A0A7R9NY47_9NEOP|nr:unnamed protein product [Timema tahoe]